MIDLLRSLSRGFMASNDTVLLVLVPMNRVPQVMEISAQ